MFFPFLQLNSRKTTLCCLMLKATDFFWLWVFEFLLLVLLLLVLLLLLLLLKGACAVTPLLTNRAGVEGARKNETKWGSDESWRGFFFFSSISSLARVDASTLKTREIGCNVKCKKNKKFYDVTYNCCWALPRWVATTWACSAYSAASCNSCNTASCSTMSL